LRAIISVACQHAPQTSCRPSTQRIFREAAGGGRDLQDDWIRTLDDGRRVKFSSQQVLDEVAFLTAQIAGNKVVYSIILSKAQNPLSRAEVEKNFEAELAKK
jgi:hypothetical protein